MAAIPRGEFIKRTTTRATIALVISGVVGVALAAAGSAPSLPVRMLE